jgi:glycoprotein endo-alpha-1,2-mannosidase
VYGSTSSTWTETQRFCTEHQLIFIPSVGPGYNDEKIRPWNAKNSKSRLNGEYYKAMFRAAINVNPSVISLTSFNEWHEGTQLEPSKPHEGYPDFSPHGPAFYLDLTRELAEEFFATKKK